MLNEVLEKIKEIIMTQNWVSQVVNSLGSMKYNYFGTVWHKHYSLYVGKNWFLVPNVQIFPDQSVTNLLTNNLHNENIKTVGIIQKSLRILPIWLVWFSVPKNCADTSRQKYAKSSCKQYV